MLVNKPSIKAKYTNTASGNSTFTNSRFKETKWPFSLPIANANINTTNTNRYENNLKIFNYIPL